MTDENALVRALEDGGISFERLYRIELERAVPAPVTSAPKPASATARRFATVTVGRRPTRPPASPDPPRWERVALFYDLHDRTMDQMLEEISSTLEGESGRWRIQVFYWDGRIETPVPGRLMGQGEDFLYSYNPRGDIILRMDPPIELDLGSEE